MPQRNVLSFLLFIYCITGFAQRNNFVLSSVWRDSTINIDGSAADWDQPYRYYDSKSKIQYSVVNDAKYVYVSLKTMDEKAQMKIMRAGMDVSIDMSGKKKETGTIRFPLKSHATLETNTDPADPDQQQVERPDVKKMRLDWSMSLKNAHTAGFKDVPADIGTPDSINKYGIEAAIDWDRSDVMTYELRVPFALFYKKELSAEDSTKYININVKINGMDLPMLPTAAADPSSDMTGTRNNIGMNNGAANSMNNNTRPQTASTQPALAIPKNVADMGVPLSVYMKMKLAYR